MIPRLSHGRWQNTIPKWRTMDRPAHIVRSHKMISAYADFTPSLTQEYIRCNLYGTSVSKGSNKQATRDFVNGQLKAGCTFSIKLESSIGAKKMPTNSTAKSTPKYRNDFSDGDSVTIVTTDLEVDCIKNVSETAFFTLCNMLKHNGKLKTITIKNVLQPIWPKNKNIFKNDIFNARLRIKRLLPRIKKCDTFESFQKSINTSKLIAGLDDETMSDNDLKMSVEISRLEQLPSTNMTTDLIAAAKILN